MPWRNPFSYNGRTGRRGFWLTIITAGILSMPLALVPVRSHLIVLSTFGGLGVSGFQYSTPVEPITPQSLIWLAAYYLGMALLIWIIFAVAVRRLHDLGRSGKWVLAPFVALVLTTLLEAIFGRPNAPLSVIDVVTLILMAPAVVIGVCGLFLMYFAPGKS